jgi:hypothetical protein
LNPVHLPGLNRTALVIVLFAFRQDAYKQGSDLVGKLDACSNRGPIETSCEFVVDVPTFGNALDDESAALQTDLCRFTTERPSRLAGA